MSGLGSPIAQPMLGCRLIRAVPSFQAAELEAVWSRIRVQSVLPYYTEGVVKSLVTDIIACFFLH
jgi:hypothetical protein